MLTLRQLAPLVLAALALSSPRRGAADTVVLVVRHAEKSAPTGDVPLSAAGEARAQVLVGIAREAGVSAIITTQFQRTRQTAAPSAEALGVVPDVAEVKGGVPDHVKAIADLVRGRFAGRTVLIVGHSNTVPAIVNALGGRKLPDLCDDSYDDLFTVVLSADGAGRLIHSRYGAPSTATAACPAIMK